MRIKDILSIRPVKWSLVIIGAVIVGIFLGRFITSYETQYLFSREYCGTYKGIDVYKCGEIDGENARAHLSLLEGAPEPLTDACSALYLTGGSLTVPIVNDENGKALGLTQNTTIYISTDTFDIDVLYHELFHAYDNANGKPSETEEFMKIAAEEGSFFMLTKYPEEVISAEVFASAGAMYLIEPTRLQRGAPLLYEYIENCLD